MPIRTTFAKVPYNATILIAYGMNTKKNDIQIILQSYDDFKDLLEKGWRR